MGFYQDRKIEAQKSRIAELEVLLSQTNEGYAECIATREDYRARIAELEKMLAVHRLAVDVDALKARIAELEAENEELKKAISKPWMGSARAAYLGEKDG